MLKPLIIGHRGARSYCPENTLPAYKYALENNVDMVDLDVVATADKVLIAYHDLVINPDILCDASGNYLADNKEELIKDAIAHSSLEQYLIKNYTLKELQDKYRVKLNHKSSYAGFFPLQQDIFDTLIPSMQEVVDYVNVLTNSTMSFQVEIKNDLDNKNYTYSHIELAKLLYDFITINNLSERIKIQAFDWRILLELNRLEPQIKTAYLVAYDFKDNWLKWFSASDVIIKASEFIRDEWKLLGISNLDDLNIDNNILYLIKYLGGYSYEPEDNELTKEQIDLAHSLGLKVYVWTWPEHSGFVTNSDVIKRLSGWGIDGFIADDPETVRNLLIKV